MPIDALHLSKLIERHGASLQLWVRSCGDSAEDAVQEAFTRLATQDPVPNNPVAWLYQVSRNVALKRRLSDRRRHDRELASAQAEVVAAPADPLEIADLHAAVASLADELREVLVARIWGQLTLEEIGQMCGVSTATAFRRYREALEALRTKIEPPCETRP
jgi:RNA polymerase sigma-70 factor (ECF subfamily)